MRAIIFHIREHLRWYILGFLTLFSIIIWTVAIHENRNGILTVAFLNIGQGNATFIESPTGTQVIVDGGPNKTLMREISSVIPWYDRHIDMLIVTHPDRDHYEGFISLLDKYSADAFMESGIKDVSEEFLTLKQKIFDKKTPDILAHRGQVIDIGGGAYIEILFPDRDVSGLETNNGSIICRVVYGDTSLLLEGDAPQIMENFVLTLGGSTMPTTGGSLKSNVIEVGHHGAKTSSSEEYIKDVAPEFAIISVGKDNTYGHPNKETLDTLNKFNVQILRTDQIGRIVFESDGKIFTKK
jgi:competence protein ComEC